MDNKLDMSKTCGFKDAEIWYKYYNGEISAKEFDEYHNNNCLKCIYASDICMYGEEPNKE